MLFFLIMPIIFSLQDNAIIFGLSLVVFFIWNHQKNNLFFAIWAMFWNISRLYFLFFSTQIIKSNCYIIFLKFFPINFFDGKFTFTLHLHLFIRSLFLVILSRFFPICSWFNMTFIAYSGGILGLFGQWYSDFGHI